MSRGPDVRHETIIPDSKDAAMIADQLRLMADLVEAHHPWRVEMSTSHHIDTDVVDDQLVRSVAGIDTMRVVVEFPRGVFIAPRSTEQEINMGKDKRTPEDKAAWDKGKFTEAQAKEAGMTVQEMNTARAEQEADLGNPLAPPK